MIALSGAVEALRLANRMSGQDLYKTMLISSDGHPVRASNGTVLMADAGISDVESISAVAVCGGLDTHAYEDKKLVSWLRRLSRSGSSIGALCTASDLLARAGLLDGYRCTIHWENLASFAERFPNVEVTNELFEIDRDRFTCSGGTAAIDMVLNMVAMQHGHELARQVSDQLIHDRIRGPHDHQRMELRSRMSASQP